ncbi:unknown [Bacteroides sp. CAG:1060]|nr:unknown [Bacteroides sp. CAG:1060]
MRIVSRIIAVSAFLMSVAFSANAQYGPSSKGQGYLHGIRQGTNGGSEYKGIVEGGVGYDFFEEQLALSVSTSHGVIFNDSFFIGANVGFFHSRVSNNNRYDLYYVPTLALDSRYYFHLQAIGLQPYIGAQAGVGFSKNDYWYYTGDSGTYTEFAMNATLMAGLRIRLNDSLGITTGIRSIYTFDNLGVLFQVGLEF